MVRPTLQAPGLHNLGPIRHLHLPSSPPFQDARLQLWMDQVCLSEAPVAAFIFTSPLYSPGMVPSPLISVVRISRRSSVSITAVIVPIIGGCRHLPPYLPQLNVAVEDNLIQLPPAKSLPSKVVQKYTTAYARPGRPYFSDSSQLIWINLAKLFSKSHRKSLLANDPASPSGLFPDSYV